MMDYICHCKFSDGLAFRVFPVELTLLIRSGHMVLIVIIAGEKYMVWYEGLL